MARYPMHWHMMGPVDGQYFARSSVWKSFNRCVTVHGTNNARVEGNVCYDHLGHGYFLEDGGETGNLLAGNLGLGTHVTDRGGAPHGRQRGDVLDHEPGQHHPRQRRGGLRGVRLLVRAARLTDRASRPAARCSRATRRCASSAATWPTPTSGRASTWTTARCPTAPPRPPSTRRAPTPPTPTPPSSPTSPTSPRTSTGRARCGSAGGTSG